MRLLTIALLIGCGTEAKDDTAQTTETVTTPTTTGTSTPTTQTTGTTTATTRPAVDCSALPTGSLPVQRLGGLPVAEDFAFDDLGNLIAHNGGSALVRQPFPPSQATAFATTDGGPTGPAGLRMLQNGDIVYANRDTGTVYQVDTSGTTTVLHSGLGYPTGIDIHNTGRVLIADPTGFYRIDTGTGLAVLVIPGTVFPFAYGVSYNADYSKVYIGNPEGIWEVGIGADGGPDGFQNLLIVPPNVAQTYGLGVDSCDNLYVLLADRLLRYGADGSGPEELLVAEPEAQLTNLQWGSGVGGWHDRTLYIVDRQAANPGYLALSVEVDSKP